MLHVESISKQFPGVRALSDVSLTFEGGEIHAVVGENGAGKSTLIKIICGIYQPDDGAITLDGRELTPRSYSDAMRVGINLVSQEIQVVPKASVAENVMLDKLERFKRARPPGLGLRSGGRPRSTPPSWGSRCLSRRAPAACRPRRSSSS